MRLPPGVGHLLAMFRQQLGRLFPLIRGLVERALNAVLASLHHLEDRPPRELPKNAEQYEKDERCPDREAQV